MVPRKDAPDQAAVRRAADPNGDVDAVRREVPIIIRKGHIRFQIGPTGQKTLERRQDVDAAQGDGHVDPKAALRRLASLRQRRLGVVNLAQDPDSMIIEEPPLLRQGDASCGAMDHLTGYSAGLGRKQALLALEAERRLPLGRSLVGAS